MGFSATVKLARSAGARFYMVIRLSLAFVGRLNRKLIRNLADLFYPQYHQGLGFSSVLTNINFLRKNRRREALPMREPPNPEDLNEFFSP